MSKRRRNQIQPPTDSLSITLCFYTIQKIYNARMKRGTYDANKTLPAIARTHRAARPCVRISDLGLPMIFYGNVRTTGT